MSAPRRDVVLVPDTEYGGTYIDLSDDPYLRADDGVFVVSVPAELVDDLRVAREMSAAASAAIFAEVGFDAEAGRFDTVCEAWVGEPYVSPGSGRVFYDDCLRCGWRFEDHPPRVEP